MYGICYDCQEKEHGRVMMYHGERVGLGNHRPIYCHECGKLISGVRPLWHSVYKMIKGEYPNE